MRRRMSQDTTRCVEEVAVDSRLPRPHLPQQQSSLSEGALRARLGESG